MARPDDPNRSESDFDPALVEIARSLGRYMARRDHARELQQAMSASAGSLASADDRGESLLTKTSISKPQNTQLDQTKVRASDPQKDRTDVDPAILELARSLARQAAREDHARELHGLISGETGDRKEGSE